MNWWDKRETRQIVDYPDGRDWRCLEERGGCGFSEPEDARPAHAGCPNCGATLHRVSVQL